LLPGCGWQSENAPLIREDIWGDLGYHRVREPRGGQVCVLSPGASLGPP
jgi:hypothetical protein